jgi:Leucine-rich repeat (LRR) protein
LTSEQLFAYQELASWYNREDKRLRKIDQLLGSPLVGRTQRNQLYFARDAIDANVSQTLKALTTCEATSSLCLQQRDQVAAQLQSMDESLLTPWRSFFYYCRKNDPDSAAGIQAVLQTLNLTDCQAAEDALSGIKDLKLRNLGLVDIEFLRSMTALQNLDISRNQISNLYALSPLRQLKTLKANRNILDSVAGLEQLKNLQHLELARNNLKTLEPIFGLGSVKFLSAYNNLLNPEELSGKFPGAKTLYSSDDACRHETSRLLAAQRIDLESAQLYLEIGFGPSYLPGGQIEWVDCEVAAETFE